MATATQERERWLFLSNLAEQLLASDNPPQVIRALSQKIAGHVQADTLLNYLIQAKENTLLLNAFTGISEDAAKRFEQVPYARNICQSLSICGTDYKPSEACPCHCVLKEIMETEGVKCFVCHPLVIQSRSLGTLVYGSHTRAQFSPDDLELMRTVAAQVAMAIYRMQNERNLREAEERWRSLSEAAFEGIMISENGIIIDLNPQLADLVGWTMKELRGQELIKFVVPEDREKLRESISTNPDRLSEYRVIRRDGNLRIFEAHGRPTQEGSSRRVTVVRDITEHKQLEADLLQKGRELQELNARLEQRVGDRTQEIEHLVAQLRALSVKLIQVEQNERYHLATILHDDVQQLLVASLMRVDLCMRDPSHERNAALCQETNQILQEALEHCRSLVVDLHPPLLHQQGLVAALHWLGEQYEQKHRFKVVFQTDAQAEPPTQELRFLLFQNARELLLNAVKHAQAPGAQVTLSRTPHQEISLCVEDQGKGFDPNAQLNPATSGFGLFSIRQRLTYFGGRMEVDSSPGQGTRITVFVPEKAAGDPVLCHPPFPAP